MYRGSEFVPRTAINPFSLQIYVYSWKAYYWFCFSGMINVT